MMSCDSPSSIWWVGCSTAHQQTWRRTPWPQRAVSPLFSYERCACVASVAVLDGVTMAALKLGALSALQVVSSRRELSRRRRSLLSRIKQILHCSLVLACIARATSMSSSQTWSFFVFFTSLARALALRPVTLTTNRLQHCRCQSPVAALNDVLRRTQSASSRLSRRPHAPAARRARALVTATTSSAKVDRPPRRAPAQRPGPAVSLALSPRSSAGCRCRCRSSGITPHAAARDGVDALLAHHRRRRALVDAANARRPARRTARRHSADCAPPSQQLDQHQLIQSSMPHAAHNRSIVNFDFSCSRRTSTCQTTKLFLM